MIEARLKPGQQRKAAAAAYLNGLGMRLLVRNLRTPVGEIDIIVRHKRLLIFVEVKTRRGNDFCSPAEAVGERKQRQIVHAAQWYINEYHGCDLQSRFDMVAVSVKGGDFHCEHIPATFEA